ncbi:MAG: bifunctional riboflavin kinase/FAD synthetase [Clostridiaceae bacterium]|nr:bifunctional riboflavin kinase/FAD synthetase [Clostridiaceae bacterium]
MKTIYGNESFTFGKRSTAVGLGNFDGLHVGHMALVNTLVSEARIHNLKSVIYTFTKHPENILRKNLFTLLLTTVGKRIQLLSETALDSLYFDEFDEEYSRIEPEDFVKQILVDRLGARLIVTGFNYRFGYMGKGDVDLLKALGRKYNFNLIVIPPVKVDNELVSSSAIREYVAKGDMEKVFKLLGRHYSITGEVMDGKRLGRRIGFPTANLHPEDYLIMPRDGVYLTKTLYKGEFYSSLTNIGMNPTFADLSKIKAETHILNFSKDIYRSSIEVFFLVKLRDEIKCKDAQDLSAQIQRDVQVAKEYFGINGF